MLIKTFEDCNYNKKNCISGKNCKFDLVDKADRREANASETSLICVNNRRQHIIQYVLYDALYIYTKRFQICDICTVALINIGALRNIFKSYRTLYNRRLGTVINAVTLHKDM